MNSYGDYDAIESVGKPMPGLLRVRHKASSVEGWLRSIASSEPACEALYRAWHLQKQFTSMGLPGWVMVHACGTEGASRYAVFEPLTISLDSLLRAGVAPGAEELAGLCRGLFKSVGVLQEHTQRPHGQITMDRVLFRENPNAGPPDLAAPLLTDIWPNAPGAAPIVTSDARAIGRVLCQFGCGLDEIPDDLAAVPDDAHLPADASAECALQWREFLNALLSGKYDREWFEKTLAAVPKTELAAAPTTPLELAVAPASALELVTLPEIHPTQEPQLQLELEAATSQDTAAAPPAAAPEKESFRFGEFEAIEPVGNPADRAYRARHQHSGRDGLLKILVIGGATDPLELRAAALESYRIQKELAETGSKGWVGVQEFGSRDDVCYVVFDPIGASLESLVHAGARPAPNELAALARGILLALMDLHALQARPHGQLNLARVMCLAKPDETATEGAAPQLTEIKPILSQDSAPLDEDFKALGLVLWQFATGRAWAPPELNSVPEGEAIFMAATPEQETSWRVLLDALMQGVHAGMPVELLINEIQQLESIDAAAAAPAALPEVIASPSSTAIDSSITEEEVPVTTEVEPEQQQTMASNAPIESAPTPATPIAESIPSPKPKAPAPRSGPMPLPPVPPPVPAAAPLAASDSTTVRPVASRIVPISVLEDTRPNTGPARGGAFKYWMAAAASIAILGIIVFAIKARGKRTATVPGQSAQAPEQVAPAALPQNPAPQPAELRSAPPGASAQTPANRAPQAAPPAPPAAVARVSLASAIAGWPPDLANTQQILDQLEPRFSAANLPAGFRPATTVQSLRSSLDALRTRVQELEREAAAGKTPATSLQSRGLVILLDLKSIDEQRRSLLAELTQAEDSQRRSAQEDEATAFVTAQAAFNLGDYPGAAAAVQLRPGVARLQQLSRQIESEAAMLKRIETALARGDYAAVNSESQKAPRKRPFSEAIATAAAEKRVLDDYQLRVEKGDYGFASDLAMRPIAAKPPFTTLLESAKKEAAKLAAAAAVVPPPVVGAVTPLPGAPKTPSSNLQLRSEIDKSVEVIEVWFGARPPEARIVYNSAQAAQLKGEVKNLQAFVGRVDTFRTMYQTNGWLDASRSVRLDRLRAAILNHRE